MNSKIKFQRMLSNMTISELLAAQLLHGLVALVTGASSGIGAAIGEHLAVAGAKVALAARRIDRLQKLQKQIEGQGGMAICVEMDVCNTESVRLATSLSFAKIFNFFSE